MAIRVPVVIPAAGKSERMGRPKPLLDFDGRTCIDLVVKACREAGCAPIYVVLGADSERIRTALPAGAEIVPLLNEAVPGGQTSSVKRGLEAVRGSVEAFFVFPADHPLVEGADLLKMMDKLAEVKNSKTGVVPTHGGRRGHPILLAGRHRAGILDLPEQAPLHDYVRSKSDELAFLELANEGVIAAMNTEEEYGRALETYRRRLGGGIA